MCVFLHLNVVYSYTWEVPLTFTTESSQDWGSPRRMWMHRDNGKTFRLNACVRLCVHVGVCILNIKGNQHNRHHSGQMRHNIQN